MLWQATIASVDRETMFPETEQRRAAARAVVRAGRDDLLLFAVTDNHLHAVFRAEREVVSARASAISHSLGALGAPPREPVRITVVNGTRHLANLVPYLCNQVAHHGIQASAAPWEGACAGDLLGLRVLPGFDVGRIAAMLPRTKIAVVAAEACGVPADVLRPATDAEIAELEPELLWRSCCAAAAAPPSGRSPETLAARAAWARLVRGQPYEAIGLPERTFYRARQTEPDALLLDVVRRRVTVVRWFRAQTERNADAAREPAKAAARVAPKVAAK